ncbi:hypothetical protein [Brevundimonas sp. DWR2-3-1b1]|uniref:hypothetical protein n=1 Tax=unclassified Brevundimonas TaxID=2622653 RepID=UPI003CF1D1F9
MTTSIPHLIQFIPPSEASVAMHEAGHAAASLVFQVAPEFMEIIEQPTLHGRNRISGVSSQQERRLIAVAGYAVEVALFAAGRLTDRSGVILTEQQFIQQALGKNAAADKIPFHDENRAGPDGGWSKDDDAKFAASGAALSEAIPLDRVTALATALVLERVVPAARIAEIWNAFLPDAPT